jgi:excisionase family DNA binding protein
MSNQDNQPEQKQEWFTLNEAAKYLRVSRQTIYNYINQGLLEYYELKSGGGKRIRRSALDALLDKHSSD